MLAPERIFEPDEVGLGGIAPVRRAADSGRDLRGARQELQCRSGADHDRRRRAARRPGAETADRTMTQAAAPIGLLAELTHRCPLQCPYCSNPVDLDRKAGGARYRDLETGVRRSRRARRAAGASLGWRADGAARPGRARRPLPATSISTPTSSPPACCSTSRPLERLDDAGLDHVQLSSRMPTAGQCRPHRRVSRRPCARSSSSASGGGARAAADRQLPWCTARTSAQSRTR